MRETLLDIVKHTGGLGFIETIRITGTKKSTVAKAMDNDRTVFIEATLQEPSSNLEGEFGLSHLDLLQGLLNFSTYKATDANIEIKTSLRNDVEVPEEIIFTGSNGSSPASYRLMNVDLLPPEAKFMGKGWDVEVTPTKAVIQEFSSLASLYSKFESHFSVKTIGNELVFNIGDEDSSSHKASVVIASDITGSLNADLYWPIDKVMNILKHGLDKNAVISISNLGALQIAFSTDHANYKFILPARKR